MIFPSLPPPLPLRGEKACCTCARLLSEVPRYGENEKKLPLEDRILRCCERVICGVCIQGNTRFAFYCPYCPDQENFPGNSDAGASLPPSRQRRRDDNRGESTYPVENNPDTSLASSPSSSLGGTPTSLGTGPSTAPSPKPVVEAESDPQQCIHHHIHPHETLTSISLLYNLSPSEIRKANSLSPTGIDDRLLFARKTVLIPGRSKSLSNTPPGGEEAERRRVGIRRWMMATREPNYDIAKTYLEGAGWDVDLATDRWFSDSAWESTNGGPPRRHDRSDDDGKKKGWLGFLGL